MFDFLAGLLAFFYDVWPSYGGAIILFTLAIMLLLTPLSLKSTRSMIRMQRVQPELKRLQAQHKGDRETLNREMMAFYQANNINPFSSCLPLLIQMPVFLVLYRVLSGLTSKEDGVFDPKYLNQDSALYKALHGASEMVSFGMDLSRSAMQELTDDGLVRALPYFLLVASVAATAWYQQRQVQGRNPQANSNPQQQMIMKFMPFIFVPITISIPAGLVIYFVVSNLVRIAQGVVVTRLEYGDKAAPVIVTPAPTAPAVKPDAKGGARPAAAKPSARVTKPATPPRATQNARNRKKKRK
jgi:YidC/Oxa1 family membrane protein insertase